MINLRPIKIRSTSLKIHFRPYSEDYTINPNPATWRQIDPSHQLGSEQSPSLERVQKELPLRVKCPSGILKTLLKNKRHEKTRKFFIQP